MNKDELKRLAYLGIPEEKPCGITIFNGSGVIGYMDFNHPDGSYSFYTKDDDGNKMIYFGDGPTD